MTRDRARTAVFAAALVACASLAGCSHPSSGPAASALRAVQCPEDVQIDLVVAHTCLRLRVPEDHRNLSGRSVDLFVVRIVPPGSAAKDPIVDLGGDVGDSLDFGGLGALAGRVHRVAYLVEDRGTGHSIPSMACPEAKSVNATTVDEAAALGIAAHECLARLRQAGNDPAWFGPADVAADADSLRRAIGAPVWNVITYGSSSVFAAQLARRYPTTVRSLVVDSPAPLASQYAGGAATWRAWINIVAGCHATAACVGAYPGISDDLWSRTALQLAAHPVQVPGLPAGSGTLGANTLSRVVRAMLAGPGPDQPALIPSTLTNLLNGLLPNDLNEELSTDSVGCMGYRPACGDSNALASYLTTMCPLLTTTSTAAGPPLPGAQALDPARTFAEACTGWPVAAPVPATLPQMLPTLVVYGTLDPFVDQATLDGWTHRPYAYLVAVPGESHNAMGFDDCPITIRNAWVNQPTSPPATDCLATMPAYQFGTSG